MIVALHDRQHEMRLLDETRRFFFTEGHVLGLVKARLAEMGYERDRYSIAIEKILAAHQLDSEKALDRLAKRRLHAAFGVQLSEELATLVKAHAYRTALDLVIDQYQSFQEIAASPSLLAIGTIVHRPNGRGEISITGSEWKTLTTPFKRETFESALGDLDGSYPGMVGVGTALRQTGREPPPPASIDIGTLANDEGERF